MSNSGAVTFAFQPILTNILKRFFIYLRIVFEQIVIIKLDRLDQRGIRSLKYSKHGGAQVQFKSLSMLDDNIVANCSEICRV